jgi:hypothetical protein
MTRVLKRLVGRKYMLMLARTPAKMKRAPTTVRIQPAVLREFQKSKPTPKSSGKRAIPKVLAPKKLQKEPTTLT